MQQNCSKETLAALFFNVSSSLLLLFLFLYFTSILLAKFFFFCGSPILQRNQDGYDSAMFYEEEEEESEYVQEGHERDHLVADVIGGGESLQFLSAGSLPEGLNYKEDDDNFDDDGQPMLDEPDEAFRSPASESELHGDEVAADDREEIHGNSDSSEEVDETIVADYATHDEKRKKEEEEKEKNTAKFTRDGNFLILAPPRSEAKKVEAPAPRKAVAIDEEEIFGDSCTVGSTSKSSSEWRSSINCRDSGTEDPFSSSSRRSCPKWESYTVFQKYDEEMLFLDRISVQKLHETESLRSIQACPRSISERIVYKLQAKNKRSSRRFHHQNPYLELEAAYVAQICLTWEALNWNYSYFQRLRASRRQSDPGCPAYIAQQFQQFQVLLQRYVENEPYEHGRRPEIYARMRSLAAKLLQVPEYRDSTEEEKEEGPGARIPSESFLRILQESIQTFMNFLKADRETHCQMLAAFFRRNRRRSADPIRLLLAKQQNKKKKMKLKDIRRGSKCLRKRRLKEEEEMEILMALIDMKVVSRVLRMAELSEEQLNWCDGKMRKVSVADGKLHRDSSPLFFPAH
ncbi:uncharacterized protein LOC127792806 [Diospyros lotus]|uniref:uncharacterized protein LOC127792806 n=1 Tax=Diospyros lotus TaxID=55363 RepID=UPI002258071D|nr:uncharacterized protein LOC127792806 [Diospyros lotus]